MTGVFLDLLLRGKIGGGSWEEFQKRYNALIIGMLERMKSQFRVGDNLGTLVEEEAKRVKQNYKKEISSYEAKYKQ